MSNQTIHTPVLLDEVMDYLDPKPEASYIDATLGAAGHTKALLSKGAHVLGIDQDAEVLRIVTNEVISDKLICCEANFMTIRTQAEKYGFTHVNGILFDLGVSSLQFDRIERGFSFQGDAPLDMRMNQKSQGTAADIVNGASEDELFEILATNAGEPKARQIAKAIVNARPIMSTRELANLVTKVYGGRRGHLHPATLTFQSIRIAVNQELKILKPALKDAFSLLKPGGRLAVISFHEGEDRIVKRTFIELNNNERATVITKTPITPSREEILHNPRARSAKLRILEKNL